MRDIGKNIRAARTARNLTQDELAERLHTTRQTVSNYETGRSRPDVEMLMQIAESLGVEVTALLYGVQTPPDRKRELKKFWIAAAVFVTLVLAFSLLLPEIREEIKRNFRGVFWLFTLSYLFHPVMFGVGWTFMQGAGIFLGAKPCKGAWTRWVRWGIVIAAIVFLLPMTIIWLDAIMAEFGMDGWAGYGSWPKWLQKWFLIGYSFVEAKYRFVLFFLGAGFWMTKGD